MIKQLAVWKLIAKSLEEGSPVMLLYVLESKGSSPGRQGFAMTVNLQGEMAGSVGGGIMELKFVEMAKEKLTEPLPEISVRKQFHDKSAAKNQSGMICSGEQTLLLYRITENDARDIQTIISVLEDSRNCSLRLTPDGMQAADTSPAFDFQYNFKWEKDWYYEEKLGYKHHLHIVGAGHCALQLSELMSMMQFRIHLYDHRADLNTFHQNTFAHKKTILNSYSELESIIPAGTDQYVVIMTVGYRTDDEALRAIHNKHLGYLGILGSKAKIEKLFAQYSSEGFSQERLAQIHAPIGIQIKSESPEEIAVSIAAEIISVKNAVKQN